MLKDSLTITAMAVAVLMVIWAAYEEPPIKDECAAGSSKSDEAMFAPCLTVDERSNGIAGSGLSLPSG
jgi:hypothetical protein